MPGSRHVAQALRGDRADGCKGILDAVVQFFEDQFLQLVSRLTLPRLNPGLGKQIPGSDFGLRQQQLEADIFRGQKLLRRLSFGDQMALALELAGFGHR